MRRLILAALIGSAALVFPASSVADPAICHDGILSDDIGQGCMNDQAYGWPYDATAPHGAYRGDGDGDADDGGAMSSVPGHRYHSYHHTYYHAAASATPAPIRTASGYCGAYQFDQPTWTSVGMPGSPCGASPAMQDQAAQRLYAQRGAEPWPHCGRYAPDWAAVRMCENSGSYAP